jgi:glycosyltransferase involved in cell wall biosynthesis
MPSPKICFLIHGLVVGGAEKFFINLANYYQREGYQPIVILLSDFNPLRNELDPEIDTHLILRKTKYDFSVSSQIRKKLEEHRVDKVFCVGTFSFFLMKLSFKMGSKIQFMLSIHSTIPKNFKDFAVNLVYLRFVSNRDKVLFICKAQKDYFRKKYYFKPKDNQIIYNGINTEYFVPEQTSPDYVAATDAVRKLYKTTPGQKIVTLVARLFAEKGHADAIDAIKILREKYKTNATLALVGSGDETYTQSLHTHAANRGVTQYVHFIPHQSDVRPYIWMSDAVTLTSHTETFSLAALEAMSCGVPCSLTDIGGAAEMINEQSGTLSIARNAESIAKSWYDIFQKSYDPLALHQFVKANFSSTRMQEDYKKVIVG